MTGNTFKPDPETGVQWIAASRAARLAQDLAALPALRRAGMLGLRLGPKMLTTIPGLNLVSNVGVPVYYGTKAVVNHLPLSWQDKLTDTVGGTINSALRMANPNWGIDDTAYLEQQARARLPPRPAATALRPQQNVQAPLMHATNPVLQTLPYLNGMPRRSLP